MLTTIVPGGENRAADRKFAFTPQQFTQHYSPTQLGASYSIWIPWGPIGGPQAQITLIPIFTSASGQLVIGESSHNILPGPTSPLSQTQQYSHSTCPPSPLVRPDPNALANPYGVQQTSLQQDMGISMPTASAAGAATRCLDALDQSARQHGRSALGRPAASRAMERLAIQRATLATTRAGPGQ